MKDIGFASPLEIPPQLVPGQHCLVFRAGPRLCLELDGFACDALGPLRVLDLVAAQMARFAENHPLLATIAIGAGPNIPGALVKKRKTMLIYHKLIMSKGGYGIAGTAFKAGGVVTLYVAAYIAIRWTQLMLTHRRSRLGGVLVEFGPPYWPIQLVPGIWPRGGPRLTKLEQHAEQKVSRAASTVLGKGQSALAKVQARLPTRVRA
jgi:hypothetical protein